MTINYFVALDGDQVGRRIEQLILRGNLTELSTYSRSILEAINLLESLILQAGGTVYMIGGDNLLAEVSNIDLFISNFMSIRENLVCSFCVGIGTDPLKAYLALKFAKSSSPKTIVKTQELEKNIQFIIIYPN